MEGTTQNTWPESYYSEKDPGLRRILLEEEIRQHPGVSENDLRQKLWEIRYVSRDKKNTGQQVDNYIGGWMEMLYLSRNNGGLFGFRYAAKELRKTIKKWDFPRRKSTGRRAGRSFTVRFIISVPFTTISAQRIRGTERSLWE